MEHIVQRLINTVFFIAISAVFSITTTAAVYAQGTDRSESGFSGRLQCGAIYLQTDSQLSTDDSNRCTNCIDGPADTHEATLALPSVLLRYRFEGGTAVYAGNPMEVLEGFALETGVSRPMGIGTLDVSFNWTPGQEVWKNPYRTGAWENPYQTGNDRDKTAVNAYGMRVELQDIAGTPLEVSYNIKSIDIEDDEIGDLDDDLKRTGRTHELEAGYTLSIEPSFFLSPKITCTYGDINGRSNSYNGIEFGIQMRSVRPSWGFAGILSGFAHQYQKTHPVFDTTRRESGITAFAQVMRLNLFGVERLFASIGAGYVLSDANIDFFDSQTIVGIAGVGLNL